MEIPAQYNPAHVEEKILKLWLDNGVFDASVSAKKKPFSIVIPPPNVTGILHMGHALNNTLQDVLIRFKRMQGAESLWMPGTDHAGIATQNVVERKLAKEGLRKEDLGREKFTEKLWEWKEEYGSTILQQLKRLGASCDWPRTRFTMDQDYSDAVKEVFVRLYEKDLIYQGNYIINWCPRCRTALSDEEAPYKDMDGWLYYIKYPVASSVPGSPTHVVVATTRPETMLGDTAIAINPDDSRYTGLKGASITLPIINRTLRVIEDEAVDPAFGTGVVKVTPAHDPVDFLMGKKYNLEFITIMHDNGVLNEQAGEFAGMDRFEAREALVEILAGKDLLLKKEPYKISAGHCYRCHTLIEPRLSLQWFVKMEPLARAAIKVVEEGNVTFYPPRWKKVYLNWMYNIQDWCISRQIWWGHRLPVYYCDTCQEEKQGKGVLVAKTAPTHCPHCKNTQLRQDSDVLDTWFSSWLWPFATLYWPLSEQSKERQAELSYFYPTNTLITASEILFFWVARMIMAGMEFMGEIPFKDVLIHGTVRDARGIKMSKSLGNVIDPLEVIEKFGADALRFSLMLLAASGSDVYLSDDKFLVGRNFANKIWNATRFILLKIKENDITVDSLVLKECDDVDQWILAQLDTTIEQVTGHLESYSINEATKRMYEFFWHSYCDWYIEIVKTNCTAQKAKVLLFVLINVLKMLHPIMPYITEEIYQLLKEHTAIPLRKSIALSAWPTKSERANQSEEIERVEKIVETIRAIRNIKVDLGLGVKKIGIEVSCPHEHLSSWKRHQSWIQRLSAASKIAFVRDLTRVLFRNDLWAVNFCMEEIDQSGYLLSLDKKIKKLDTILNKISARLANNAFLSHAPAATVEQEKTKSQELSGELTRLKDLRQALV